MKRYTINQKVIRKNSYWQKLQWFCLLYVGAIVVVGGFVFLMRMLLGLN